MATAPLSCPPHWDDSQSKGQLRAGVARPGPTTGCEKVEKNLNGEVAKRGDDLADSIMDHEVACEIDEDRKARPEDHVPHR